MVQPGRRIEEKRTGHDRTWQSKVTKALYFTYLGRSPHWSDFHKNLHSSCRRRCNHVCKLWAEIFRGYDFTGGRISRFPIDSFMGLTTVQRYCAACDVQSDHLLHGYMFPVFFATDQLHVHHALLNFSPCRNKMLLQLVRITDWYSIRVKRWKRSKICAFYKVVRWHFSGVVGKGLIVRDSPGHSGTVGHPNWIIK